MSLELYLTFIAATIILMVIPGPNVALIVANSIAHGRSYGLITVAGTSAAMVPQLLLTVLGMSAMLSLLGSVLEWIRWAGVLYLIYLGVKTWTGGEKDLEHVTAQAKAGRSIFIRGFLVSIANPKTLLFYGAFLPQFISESASLAAQLVVLALTFLTVAVTADSCWALAAARFRSLLHARARLRNRISGGFYLVAAIGLSAARGLKT